MITFLNEPNWLSVPSCSVYLDFVQLVTVIHLQILNKAPFGSSLFSVPDTRTETDTRIHTVCQSCSFSASHNILYKSYINASSTAFLKWCTSPPHLSKETVHTSQTYLHSSSSSYTICTWICISQRIPGVHFNNYLREENPKKRKICTAIEMHA